MLYDCNGIRIGVYHIPKHKRPSLVVGNGNEMKVVASFNSEKSAEEYELYLEVILKDLNRQTMSSW